MPDGSPQLTKTWVDTVGASLLINTTVREHQKLRTVERDPQRGVDAADPEDPSRYHAVRRRVLDVTTGRAHQHIEPLTQRYLDGPRPWFGGRDQVRLLVTPQPQRISSPRD